MNLFSEIECDAFCELFNVGMGVAASSLAELIGEEVLLSVPKLDAILTEEAAVYLEREIGSEIIGASMAVSGAFKGSTCLVFPKECGDNFVRSVAGDSLSDKDLIEMRSSVLEEVSNIIINACIAALANAFTDEIKVGIPEFIQTNVAGLLNGEGENPVVLFLWVNFLIRDGDICGYVVFSVDFPSIAMIRRKLQELLKGS